MEIQGGATRDGREIPQPSIESVAGDSKIANEPHYLRLPSAKAGARCPVSKLSRSTLRRLIRDGHVRAAKVTHQCSKRSITLINRQSLLDYLSSTEARCGFAQPKCREFRRDLTRDALRAFWNEQFEPRVWAKIPALSRRWFAWVGSDNEIKLIDKPAFVFEVISEWKMPLIERIAGWLLLSAALRENGYDAIAGEIDEFMCNGPVKSLESNPCPKTRQKRRDMRDIIVGMLNGLKYQGDPIPERLGLHDPRNNNGTCQSTIS